MTKFIRYAMATFCFAASVGCLLLWGWWSDKLINITYRAINYQVSVQAEAGFASICSFSEETPRQAPTWDAVVTFILDEPWFYEELPLQGRFGHDANCVYFPLWYPALVFALAGVGVTRVSRQFSIRSALIATSVVAALIGMAVIL